jgi:beta-galactosidase
MIENSKRVTLPLNKNWLVNYTGGDKRPDDSSWQPITLPHDFSVSGVKSAWYKKRFAIPEKYRGSRFILHFEGIAAHSRVYFNGFTAARHFSGTTPFSVDITDYMRFDTENTLTVFADTTDVDCSHNIGGGINKPVTLEITNRACFTEEPKITVTKSSRGDWHIAVAGKVTGINGAMGIKNTVYDPYDSPILTFDGDSAVVHDPEIWDINNPVLYTLKVSLTVGGVLTDEYVCRFGFRSIEITPDKGFFLNGRSIKIYGVCENSGLPGVGTALPDSLYIYKISRMKEMGANAVRFTGGMAPAGLVRACDRLGMLLMDGNENTHFDSSRETEDELAAMVARDYNHPSVAFYALPEHKGSNETAAKIAKHLYDTIRALDKTRIITAPNSVLYDTAGVLDVYGINASINTRIASYDEYHRQYAHKAFIVTEIATAPGVRNSLEEKDFTAENSLTGTWAAITDRAYLAGGFIESGFDSLSPCGMTDNCGFAKDGYYLSKAVFAKSPFVRFFPDYDGVPGETVKLVCASNCPEVETFVNGESLGRKHTDRFKPTVWEFPFTPGSVTVAGYSSLGERLCEFSEKSPETFCEIKLNPFFDAFDDRTDLIPVTLTAVDAGGCYCPGADCAFTVMVEGGKLAGSGNGNPDRAQSGFENALFYGKALLIISPDDDAVFVKATLTYDSGKTASVTIPNKKHKTAFTL